MAEVNVSAFTVKYISIQDRLVTKCGVSIPFDPSSEGEHPAVLEVQALWDTGATGSVITSEVAAKLGIAPTGRTQVYHANGSDEVNVYYINILLPNDVGFSTIKVTEGVLSGFDILIGMDIISKGDFAVSNHNNKTTFSFEVPSVCEVDFLEHHNRAAAKIPAKSQKTANRNDSCPCGSGKKHKNCCGKK